MRIEDSVRLDYSDVLIRPKRSTLTSRSEVDLTRELHFRYSDLTYRGIPIMAANMDTTGTFSMARALSKKQMFTCIHKHYTRKEWCEAMMPNTEPFVDHIAVSTGISNDDYAKLSGILSSFTDIGYICIDVANGYSEHFIDFVRTTRAKFPSKVIIAGNVVTADMTEALILAGADVVKVGIGPGSVCTTRAKTGVGMPQLSAVIECADAAHGLSGHIVADGGCTNPGDVAKAFGAGADFVMLGGMLAGHAESEGETFALNSDGNYYMTIPGRPETATHMKFYGMSSATAQDLHGDGLTGYRASEGKSVMLPYRGPVANTIQDILGGLRSACTYTGSRRLKELPKRTTFVRVHNQLNNVYGTDTNG